MSLLTHFNGEITIGSYVLLHNCVDAGVNAELEGGLGIVNDIDRYGDNTYYVVLVPFYNRVITLLLKEANLIKVNPNALKGGGAN